MLNIPLCFAHAAGNRGDRRRLRQRRRIRTPRRNGRRGRHARPSCRPGDAPRVDHRGRPLRRSRPYFSGRSDLVPTFPDASRAAFARCRLQPRQRPRVVTPPFSELVARPLDAVARRDDFWRKGGVLGPSGLRFLQPKACPPPTNRLLGRGCRTEKMGESWGEIGPINGNCRSRFRPRVVSATFWDSRLGETRRHSPRRSQPPP